MVHHLHTKGHFNTNPPRHATFHIANHVMNQEAIVTAFLVEKSLAFIMAEPIIDMAQELSKDLQTLPKLHLFGTMASYKMVYGTRKTFNDNVVKTLQITPFAALNYSKMCAVLVTYSKANNIITGHLNSFTNPAVSSKVFFEGMISLFERLKLPWTNLLAILMNSCSVMRESKSGLEKHLRDSIAPHLLAIDGEICHHIHDIVKKFMTTLGNFLEKLFQDVFQD